MTLSKDMTLRTVSTFRDMAAFGINGLTGEACAFGMRMLCDVSEQGKALLAEFFGMPDIQLAKNWNSYVGDQPSIGSIMLTHRICKELAQFAMFREGAIAVLVFDERDVTALDQVNLERWRKYLAERPEEEHHYRISVNPSSYSSNPSVGSRNVHQATGRTH